MLVSTTNSVVWQPISVFGDDYVYESSDSTSSTSSTSYQRKLRLSAYNLPAGDYRINWYYEWSSTGSYWGGGAFRARVQINNTTTIMEYDTNPSDYGNDRWKPASGFYVGSLSGDVDIDLDYCISNNNYSSYIRRARLDIWRVS